MSPDLRTWIDQEASKPHRQGEAEGSPRETDLLETWKRVRPKMFHELGLTMAARLAFVLVEKCYQSRKQYVRAGMPPTDAEEQATREWCLLEPEDS